MGQSSSAPSSSSNAISASLISNIITGDLEGVSRLLAANPELLKASLDLDHGHTPVHYAVLAKSHTILTYMLSFATAQR